MRKRRRKRYRSRAGEKHRRPGHVQRRRCVRGLGGGRGRGLVRRRGGGRRRGKDRGAAVEFWRGRWLAPLLRSRRRHRGKGWRNRGMMRYRCLFGPCSCSCCCWYCCCCRCSRRRCCCCCCCWCHQGRRGRSLHEAGRQWPRPHRGPLRAGSPCGLLCWLPASQGVRVLLDLNLSACLAFREEEDVNTRTGAQRNDLDG